MALKMLSGTLNAASPDAIIATGDITQSGREREFEEAAAYFREFSAPLMVIPGNHDVPVYNPLLRFADPWRRFRRILKTEPGAVLDLQGFRVIGLNSARRAGSTFDWSQGDLSARQIKKAAQAAKDAPIGALRVVGLHHPVESAPGKAGQAVIGRAGDALGAFSEAGVDIILTGHVHISRARVHAGSTRSLVIATAGTACSTRQRGEAPSFNLIEGDRSAVSIALCRFEEGHYAERVRRQFTQDERGWHEHS